MGVQAAPGYIADPTFNHPAELDRNILEGIFPRSGAVDPGHFELSVGVGTRAISVFAGKFIIEGTENATQGSYHVWSDAAETTLLAAAVGNPRIDSCILRVADNQYGTIGGSPQAYIDWVQGVAAGSPTARPDSDFNVGGPFYIPGAWWRLGDVRVNVADTGSIPAGQITNNYSYCRPPGSLLLVPSTKKPVVPTLGDQVFETDTNIRRSWTGSAWQMITPYQNTIQLGSAASEINMTGIPSTLRRLDVRYGIRASVAAQAENLLMRVNNVSSGHGYTQTIQQNVTLNASANSQGGNHFPIGIVTASSAPAGFVGSSHIRIANWHAPSGARPHFIWQSGAYGTTVANAYNEYGQGWYNNAGPYTSLRFITLGGGNLEAGSWVTVEGWE